MNHPAKTSAPVPHPAIAINTLLSMANDCLERAGGCLDPQTFCPLDAAYVDQQLFRATTFISKARAIAVSHHGVPALVAMKCGESWHPDDVVELAYSADTAQKGGAS